MIIYVATLASSPAIFQCCTQEKEGPGKIYHVRDVGWKGLDQLSGTCTLVCVHCIKTRTVGVPKTSYGVLGSSVDRASEEIAG